ncbi:hypothetical protein SBF1_660004 [Candidatus Desulfosporosinus infrequens]|uniref:Uncharacterized protein n=1 Tax=Candidatus Desulfosporosinus infrequens TaxID=2043169 RepID=A0A2U3LN63_9FIRM|nr:hypothetical protein SBF1_660004 [Candidatus Desulfosporosinus infrequens]
MKSPLKLWTSGNIMDDAPIRIIQLRDADKCTFNEALKDARNKSTIIDLEREYENWFNYLGTYRNSSEGASK